jgi:arabinofuranosyltransferase
MLPNGNAVGISLPRLPITLALLILASSGISLLLFPFTLDDAYITFHYARNFAEGYPLGTFNVGEPPVEGFSSMLYTLLISLGMRLHQSPFYLSKIVGYLCIVAMPIITYAAYRITLRKQAPDFADADTLACGSIFLAASIPLFYYAVTGMEANFFSLQLLLLLLAPNLTVGSSRAWMFCFISSALVLTRPEGALLAFLVNGYWLLARRDDSPRYWALAGLLATAVTFAGLTIFRLHQFHELLPNTYFAKATGGSGVHRLYLGARYEFRVLELLAPSFIPLAGLLIWRYKRIVENQFLALLFVLGIAYSLYVLKVGGDPDSAFPLRRHFVHIAPVIALLLGGAISRSIKSKQRAYKLSLALAVSTAFWVTAGWCLPQLQNGLQAARANGLLRLQTPEPVWAWFARYSSSRTLTAVTGAGKWPYLIPGTFIDMLGLNDRHIAKDGFVDSKSKFQDSKSDMAYVFSREPDIIDGYMAVTPLLENKCPDIEHSNRVLMLDHMRANPVFQKDYVFVVNGPYQVWERAVFFRSDYLKSLNAPELVVLPVTKTAIYKLGCE